MTRLIDRRRRLVLETPLLIGKRPLVVLVEPWSLASVLKVAARTSASRGRSFGIGPQSLPRSRGEAQQARLEERASYCKRRAIFIMSVNKVIFVAHLGKEPYVKYLGSGFAIFRF